MYYFTEYASPLGKLILASSGEKLAGLWMEGQKYFSGTAHMTPCGDLSIFTQTSGWLDRYFAGEQPDAKELPLDPAGSAFRRSVWQLLCEIPYGCVTTYGRIAEKLSVRKGACAVGNAVGHNPVSIIIPCHRVLGADGKLRGYAGGIEKKMWLLKHEGQRSAPPHH